MQRLALRMASFIDLRTASLRLDFVFSALLLCRRFAVGRLMASHFDKSALIRSLPYVLYPGASSLTELRPAANLLPDFKTDAEFRFEANLSSFYRWPDLGAEMPFPGHGFTTHLEPKVLRKSGQVRDGIREHPSL